MSLLDSELARLKAELGISVLTVGAEPYIGITRLFELVIQPYTSAGAVTTSATAVVSANPAAPVALTLASATGFASGARVVVDVDSRQELATIQSLAGSAMTVVLSLAHTGTYPVTVEGGESIIRDMLKRIATATDALTQGLASIGVKKVDEIEFFSARDMNLTLGAFGGIWRAREMLRRELAEVLGIPYMRDSKRGGAGTTSIY